MVGRRPLAPDLAVFVLRILLVGLVYLFLIAVVMAARGTARPAAPSLRPLARRLVVLGAGPNGPPIGLAIALQPETTIGRADDCTLPLPDSVVSGRHARLTLRQEAWWLEDLESTNGTSLNGRPIAAPTLAQAGDEIGIGPARLRLEP